MTTNLQRYPGSGFDLDVNVGRVCISVWWDPARPWRGDAIERKFSVIISRRRLKRA